MKYRINKSQSKWVIWGSRLVPLALIVAAGYWFAGVGQFTVPQDMVADSQSAQTSDESKETSGELLIIDKLGVEAPVIYVGTDANGVMTAPVSLTDVGWYKYGAYPGQVGNAVLAGHYNGGADNTVFARLKELSPGDRLEFVDKAGQRQIFEVSSSREVTYDTTDVADVFGPSDERQLNLITCSGKWNNDIQTYEKRLIVYTKALDQTASR